ncbi:toxin-antitoxin system HicB family antitoxin [Endozoicomonas sp. SM1973]|uniref:Toxin-antitoxin system HicB family antitoxin n=1 Tax=Spartinivicinus marinus TaxID=2994442 RepID=A0A853I6Q9_9GAMM|nr:MULTISPECIES: toxin-antitoxin system HicB family antitoxin [Spartinivicinus]NYZ69600.1 toxin-antitoxin system HicB family antitoxin [Spartinivicinus marinus]
MATITYRTTDQKRDKLAQMAKEQNVSVNKVLDELVTIALTERDSYLRFSARASRGDANKALEILQARSTDD